MMLMRVVADITKTELNDEQSMKNEHNLYSEPDSEVNMSEIKWSIEEIISLNAGIIQHFDVGYIIREYQDRAEKIYKGSEKLCEYLKNIKLDEGELSSKQIKEISSYMEKCKHTIELLISYTNKHCMYNINRKIDMMIKSSREISAELIKLMDEEKKNK